MSSLSPRPWTLPAACPRSFVHRGKVQLARANLPHALAQPAVCRICVEAWVPEHRDRELGSRYRKLETVHPSAQLGGVTLRDGGDEIGPASQRDRSREAAREPSHDLSFVAQLPQR